MFLFKLLAYGFIYGVAIYTMFYYYPPVDIYGYMTVGVCVAGAALLLLLSLNRAAFWVDVNNPYIVGGWVSLALFLFLLMFAVDAGQELYTFFILAAAALVGLLNLDKPKYILLQHEPRSSLSFVRGMLWGVVGFIAANFVLGIFVGSTIIRNPVAAELLVGPITSQIEDWIGIGVEFILMLFLVAVPEELMGRVFYMRMGSSVTDPFSAGLITLASGYAMHAVTRYDLECGTLVLLVLTIVWLIITIAYIRHGLLASISAHATYNTLITASIYGFEYVVVSLVVIMIVVLAVHWAKKKSVLF